MFRRIFRQRRRILFSALFIGLATFGTLSRHSDLFLEQAAAPWLVPLAFAIGSFAIGLIYAGLCALVILLIPDWRGLCEILALTFFVDAILAFPMPDYFGIDSSATYALFTWFVLYFVIWSLIFGTWLDRFRLWLGYRATRRFTSPLSPDELWRCMVLGQAPASQFYDPLLADVEPDPEDPDSFDVTYRHGHSLFEHQSITYLQRLPGQGFRYYFQGEADRLNQSLTEGTFEARFASLADGKTRVTLIENRPSMLPRLALAMWLDDTLGDTCDGLCARHNNRRDWSLTGRYRRSVAKLA